MIKTKKIEQLVRQLLEALNDNPDREGLRDTPRRVAKYYAEMFEGQNYTNAQLAKKFGKCFKQDADGQIVSVDDITIFSHCEHHLALMYDMKVSIRYIPHGKVLGLSKFARISEMVGKRLQLQEKIGSDIAEVIMLATGRKDVEVRIEAKHACVTARGAKNCNMVTRTLFSSGAFKTHLTSNVTESIS